MDEPIVWHEGPPPSIGWWPASVYQDPTSLRWWNGASWSAVVRKGATPEVIATACDFNYSLTGAIRWTERPTDWPAASYT